MFRTTLRSTILRASFLLLATLVFACSSDGNKETAEGAAGGGSDAAPAAQIPTGHFVGPVTETMDAGGYTYVKLEKNGESIWAAGPETKVAVGDEVFVELAMPMPQFESPALGRKFDVLYFVGGFGTPEQAGSPGGGTAVAPPAGMTGMGGDAPSMENPHAGLPGFDEGSAEAPKVASLKKPKGGYQIAEIWSQRNQLVDGEVLVRGEVVKYNPQILGTNWVHIQDGSGDAGAGTHDLTVTTSDEVSVGDVVTVRGRLVQDQDFGSGYRYELLVEKASVQSES